MTFAENRVLLPNDLHGSMPAAGPKAKDLFSSPNHTDRRKMTRELTSEIRTAVQRFFPEDSACVEARLLTATAFVRAHQDILAFSFGDRVKLEELCQRCEGYLGDERNVYILEDRPEEYLTGIPRKDDAAAEMARRFEELGFDGIWRFAHWGHWSKYWKKEWPIQQPEPTPVLRTGVAHR